MKFSLFLCIMLAVAFFAINLFLVLTASPSAPPAVASDGAFVARLVAPGSDRIDPLGEVTLLVDTSASRASMIGRQIAVVQATIAEIARTHPTVAMRLAPRQWRRRRPHGSQLKRAAKCHPP